MPLRYIVTFAPTTVDRFLADIVADSGEGVSAGTARNYRAHIRRVAVALGVAISAAPTPIQRTARAIPYSEPELRQFRLWRRARANGPSRARAEALLTLGAGAGLRRDEILQVRARDVILDETDAWVRVHGDRERITPVLTPWPRMLARRVEQLEPDQLLFPQPTPLDASGFKAWISSTPGSPEPRRLRATYLVDLLRLDIEPSVMLAWSGVERGETLAGYLPFLPGPADEARRRELIRVRANPVIIDHTQLWAMPRINVVEGAATELGRTES